jgi:hypothetical protein
MKLGLREVRLEKSTETTARATDHLPERQAAVRRMCFHDEALIDAFLAPLGSSVDLLLDDVKP